MMKHVVVQVHDHSDSGRREGEAPSQPPVLNLVHTYLVGKPLDRLLLTVGILCGDFRRQNGTARFVRQRLGRSLALPIMFALFASTTFAQDAAPNSTSDQHVIVVVGAPGNDDYAERFAAWAEQWKASAAHTNLTIVGLDGDGSDDKDQLQKQFVELAKQPPSGEVWLVLIGHGTFDGKRAKFNLRGKDLEAAKLAEWLTPLKQRFVLINCASSSSPFINRISGKNRIIVSSTRSGFEYNYSRFGGFMATAINDLANDLDKDGQTSVLEAFCSASQSVAAVYQQDNRLATEHALIDDNGDGKGTPADWFDGTRVTRKPKEGLADGLGANSICLTRHGIDATFTAEQRLRRYELEAQLERLRSRKSKMDEASYLARIEPVLIELSQLYEDADK